MQSTLLSVGVWVVARTGQAASLKGYPVCEPGAAPAPGRGDSSGIVTGMLCQAVCGVGCFPALVGALLPFVSCVHSNVFFLLLPLVPAVPALWLCHSAKVDPALSQSPRESPDLSVSYLDSLGDPCCFSAALFLHGLSPLFPQGPWLQALSILGTGLLAWSSPELIRTVLHERVSLGILHFAMGSLSAFPPHSLPAVFTDIAAEVIVQVCFCHQQKSQWLMDLASDFEG